jgi:chorismate mutase
MTLQELRQEIDNLDKEVITLIQKRMILTHKVQDLKSKKQLPVEDLQRENQIVNGLLGQFPDVSSGLIMDIYKVIFKHSKSSTK